MPNRACPGAAQSIRPAKGLRRVDDAAAAIIGRAPAPREGRRRISPRTRNSGPRQFPAGLSQHPDFRCEGQSVWHGHLKPGARPVNKERRGKRQKGRLNSILYSTVIGTRKLKTRFRNWSAPGQENRPVRVPPSVKAGHDGLAAGDIACRPERTANTLSPS